MTTRTGQAGKEVDEEVETKEEDDMLTDVMVLKKEKSVHCGALREDVKNFDTTGLSIFPNMERNKDCVLESSRTDPDDDVVVDVTSFSALDVVEKNIASSSSHHLYCKCCFWKLGQPCSMKRRRTRKRGRWEGKDNT